MPLYLFMTATGPREARLQNICNPWQIESWTILAFPEDLASGVTIFPFPSNSTSRVFKFYGLVTLRNSLMFKYMSSSIYRSIPASKRYLAPRPLPASRYFKVQRYRFLPAYGACRWLQIQFCAATLQNVVTQTWTLSQFPISDFTWHDHLIN